MCNFGKFFRRAMTPPGTGGREAEAIQAEQIAKRQAEEAAAAAKKAMDQAAELAAAGTDNEAARQARERRFRRAIASNAGGGMPGDAPVAYNFLWGS